MPLHTDSSALSRKAMSRLRGLATGSARRYPHALCFREAVASQVLVGETPIPGDLAPEPVRGLKLLGNLAAGELDLRRDQAPGLAPVDVDLYRPFAVRDAVA